MGEKDPESGTWSILTVERVSQNHIDLLYPVIPLVDGIEPVAGL